MNENWKLNLELMLKNMGALEWVYVVFCILAAFSIFWYYYTIKGELRDAKKKREEDG